MIHDLWYKNSVFYSLDLETFMDANGDGVGDFEGLNRRLDYLDSLGVDVLWLAPFQPSPNRDNGYDVTDYYGVNARHGSSGDFVQFINEAKQRGMRVILDLVINHTSNEHPWFKQARRDPQSPYRDWYLWSKRRPPDWNKGMVFPGVQKAIWTRDPAAGEYYYHRFYDFQPDLNMDNPRVREEIRRIMGYWLQLGVDGFRVDAVPFIIEPSKSGWPGKAGKKRGKPGDKQSSESSSDLRYQYVAEMRQFLQWRAGDAALLGEANVLPQDNKRYYGDGRDGLNMMFNFWVNQHLFHSLAAEDSKSLADALLATRDIPGTAQWGVFLRNHDELDIDRLPPKQRKLVFERFGPEPRMQLYGRGIRRRLAPMLGDRRHVELAHSLLFSLPGAPVMRYGDEIGMGEDLDLKERDAVRTPMQWTAERNAGFSTARRLVHPVISKGPYAYHTVNVESQRRDPRSLLNWTARVIRMRKECPEIGWGEWKLLEAGASAVLAICYTWRGNRVIVVHNFSRAAQRIKLRVEGDDGELLANLFEKEDSRRGPDGSHHITIDAYGYRWYRAGGLNYSVRNISRPSVTDD